SQRTAVRGALQAPATGASLLALLQWVEDLPADVQLTPALKVSLRHWARQRIRRLSQQLRAARKVADTPEQWHRVRILAKRLRYGSENLQDLLPDRAATQSVQRAEAIQNSLGAARDLGQLSALVAGLALEPGVAEFLRGVVAGAGRR
ncbi:MAG: CHAD domain-containing protein, partial [Rhodoferax sp.]|nr:CHAD domain-containing protein [Rhodoferax sp.]